MSCSIKISKKCRFSFLIKDKSEERYEYLQRRISISFQRRSWRGWVNGYQSDRETGYYLQNRKTREIQLVSFIPEVTPSLGNCVCACAAASSACSIVQGTALNNERAQNEVECNAAMNAQKEATKQEGIAAGYDGIARRDETLGFVQQEPILSTYEVINRLSTQYGINNIRNVNISYGHWLPSHFGNWMWTGLPTTRILNGGYNGQETTWAVVNDSPTGLYCGSGRRSSVGISNFWK